MLGESDRVALALETIAQLSSTEALKVAEAAAAPVLKAAQVLNAAKAAHENAVAHENAILVNPASTRAEKRLAMDASEAAEQVQVEAFAVLDALLAGFCDELGNFARSIPAQEPLAPAAALPEFVAASEEDEAKASVHPIDAEPVADAEQPDDAPAEAAYVRLAPELAEAAWAQSEPSANVVPGSDGEQSEPDLPPLISPDPVPAQTSVGSDDPEPAVWTGRKSLEDLIAIYLDSDQISLAWHLADLAEEQGLRPPVPAIALKALLGGTALAGPYDASTQTLGEWLAAMMSAVEEADSAG